MTASDKAAINRRGVGPGIRRWLAGMDQQIEGLVIALVVLLIFFGIRIPGQFFNPLNLMSIGEGVTLIGIAALVVHRGAHFGWTGRIARFAGRFLLGRRRGGDDAH